MRNNNDIIEGNLIIRKDRKSEGKWPEMKKVRGNMRNNNDIIEGNLIIRKNRKS